MKKQIPEAPRQTNLETMSTEELARLLNVQYQQLMLTQQNLLIINKVIDDRVGKLKVEENKA